MSRPIHVEESVTVAQSPEVVWSVVAEYVADSMVTEVGAMTYRFESSGTLGKLAGSRTVVAGESPSEAVFSYEIEITPSGMNRLLRPIIARTSRGGLRGDLERFRELVEQS